MNKTGLNEKKYIAIDLGTAKTRVYIEGRGIIFDEPSLIAVDTRTRKILGIGNEAKKYNGKLLRNSRVYNLLNQGIITDMNLAVLFLKNVFKKFIEDLKDYYVAVAVPAGITDVEKNALISVIYSLGVYYVTSEEALKLACYGAGGKIEDTRIRLLLDLGAGKSACGLLMYDELIRSERIRLSGNLIDEEIIKELKNKKNIAIGLQAAEKVKNSIGSLFKTKEKSWTPIYGYEITSGLPNEEKVFDDELVPLLDHLFASVNDLIKKIIESAEEDIAEDVLQNGILITGGLAKIKGLSIFIQDIFQFPVIIPKNSEYSVIEGAVKYRDKIRDKYELENMKIKKNDEQFLK